MVGADGSELISGDCVVFRGVEVLELLDNGMVMGSHRLVHPRQDVFVGRVSGRGRGWDLGHVLCPLISNLQRTE